MDFNGGQSLAYMRSRGVVPAQRPGLAFLIVLTFLIFLGFVVFQFVSVFPGLSDTSLIEILFDIPIGIQPHFVTYLVVWAINFLFQAIWLMYGMATLCLLTPGGASYLYFDPPYMPMSLYAVFLFCMLFGVGWVVSLYFLGASSMALVAMILMAILTVLLVTCIVLSIQGLKQYGVLLIQSGLGVHVAIVRGMVHNGLAMFAAYTAFQTLLDLSIVLALYAGASNDMAGAIPLGIFAGEGLIYVILDWCVFEPHMRYIFTPYFTWLGLLFGLYVEHGDPDDLTVTAIMIIVCLALTAFALLVKIIFATVRICTTPDPIMDGGDVITNTMTLNSKSSNSSTNILVDPRMIGNVGNIALVDEVVMLPPVATGSIDKVHYIGTPNGGHVNGTVLPALLPSTQYHAPQQDISVANCTIPVVPNQGTMISGSNTPCTCNNHVCNGNGNMVTNGINANNIQGHSNACLISVNGSCLPNTQITSQGNGNTYGQHIPAGFGNVVVPQVVSNTMTLGGNTYSADRFTGSQTLVNVLQ